MNIKLLRNLFLISMTNSHNFKTNNQIIFAELSLILAGNFDVVCMLTYSIVKIEGEHLKRTRKYNKYKFFISILYVICNV